VQFSLVEHEVDEVGVLRAMGMRSPRRAIASTSASEEANVLRTNVPKEQLDTPGVVLAYKSLGHVERAFRHFKLCDLEVRPIYHYTEARVRAHC